MAAMNVIYLDHNATTPLVPEVAAAMAPWQSQAGNPGSQHQAGRKARRALEDAREEIARILGAKLSGPRPDRLIFTSGGTEANNQVLFSASGGVAGQVVPGEAIVSALEHPSVLAATAWLEQRGWKVHRLRASSTGVVELSHFDELLSERTRLVSVMLANNETGAIQPIAEIAARCTRLGVPLHTDAAQAVGKIAFDFASLGAAWMTVAAHKFHGPLGIGALIARHDVPLEPLLVGGFQQDGLRPGTESVALAVGMHAALANWEREADERVARMRSLRNRLEQQLTAGYPGQLVINAAAAPRLPHVSNVAFLGLDRQALLMALDLAGVACSTGSACASGSSEPSPVLAAMGCSREILDSSLRFSLGATTTEPEIDEAVRRILQACRKILHPAAMATT